MADGLTQDEIERVSRQWGQVRDRTNHWSMLPASNRRLAEALGGDPQIGPWGYLAKKYIEPIAGQLERAASLVCGQGHLERWLSDSYPAVQIDAIDVSDAAIGIAERLAQEGGYENIRYTVGDANRLDLEGTYDLILVSGGMHHIAALEHVYAEISAHLARPHGVLLLSEYVGPRLTQCTPRQVDGINACIRLLPEKYRLTVAAQRELGVTTKEAGMALLAARKNTLRNDVEALCTTWSQPTVNALPVLQPGTDRMSGTPVRIRCLPAQWHYAFEIAVPPTRGPFASLVGYADLLVDLEVIGAAVGVGIVGADRSTYIVNERICTVADGRTHVHLPLDVPIPDGAALMFRAVETTGVAPEVSFYGVAATPSAALLSDTLAGNPAFARYFLNDYRNMSPAEWRRVDPSEAIRSDEVIPVLKRYFDEVEIVDGKGALLHFALFDIAANFAAETAEDLAWLEMLFAIEDTMSAWDDVPMCWASIAAR